MQILEQEIKKLSDDELVSKLNILTAEERKITMEILHYLPLLTGLFSTRSSL